MTQAYAAELDTAVTAAQAAGAILREAFNRPDGPIGRGGHAEADRPAEKMIWERLHTAFPEDGYLGEEMPEVARSPGANGRLWVVDPNDGTSAFMRGFRGATVSIALLLEGEPVLGVVYAYNWPDDNGDLLAWARGGPLLRNGTPIAPDWPNEPGPECVVFVSQDADKNPEANAACVAPMRFRAVPGIAYRLALTAAGEGVAGVSLNGPNIWDCAGGHALLLGVGGDLFRSDGRPVRYTRDGACDAARYVFGGSKSFVDHIRNSEWDSVFAESVTQEPYALCWPTSGGGRIEPGMHSRAQGCFLGQLAGDALGSMVEFERPETIRKRYSEGVRDMADGGTHNTIAGQPTDDSEMALLLARTLVEHGAYDANAARKAYVFWLDSEPFDCGGTIGGALRGRFDSDSQANGAMMRISPLGIVGARCPLEDVAEWARQDAVITHINPMCPQANALYAMAIAHTIRTGPTPVELYAHIVSWTRELQCDDALVETIAAAEITPPEDYCGSAGWVLVAFQNALWQLLHAPDLETAVIDTVMRGGDTDTNAAICGALLGAMYGRPAIPWRWCDRVLSCRPIEGHPGVARPRPRCLWPVDAMTLVDRLLSER